MMKIVLMSQQIERFKFLKVLKSTQRSTRGEESEEILNIVKRYWWTRKEVAGTRKTVVLERKR